MTFQVAEFRGFPSNPALVRNWVVRYREKLSLLAEFE